MNQYLRQKSQDDTSLILPSSSTTFHVAAAPLLPLITISKRRRPVILGTRRGDVIGREILQTRHSAHPDTLLFQVQVHEFGAQTGPLGIRIEDGRRKGRFAAQLGHQPAYGILPMRTGFGEGRIERFFQSHTSGMILKPVSNRNLYSKTVEDN